MGISITTAMTVWVKEYIIAKSNKHFLNSLKFLNYNSITFYSVQLSSCLLMCQVNSQMANYRKSET